MQVPLRYSVMRQVVYMQTLSSSQARCARPRARRRIHAGCNVRGRVIKCLYMQIVEESSEVAPVTFTPTPSHTSHLSPRRTRGLMKVNSP